MSILKADKKNIKEAAGHLKDGGVVAFPTETVYGLGADALNPIAVTKIFEIKKRPFFDPLIVHIADISAIEELTEPFPESVTTLAERFWPGPLTIVLKKSKLIPDIVTAGLDTVALRIPAHPAAQELIKQAGTPIAAPSANPFGFISPTEASHVFEQFGEQVKFILDGGPSRVGIESTIIKIDGDRTQLLRPGGIPIEEIEAITGPVIKSTEKSNIPDSPGQLEYHYSPRTPVKLITNIDIISERSGTALLAFRTPDHAVPFETVEILSPSGDLNEAAANLFSMLHKLDSSGANIIYAESIQEHGLGIAIMDRLRKAAGKEKE